jgi:hypothetical protein
LAVSADKKLVLVELFYRFTHEFHLLVATCAAVADEQMKFQL